ncbi:hypothetical protein D9M73_294720 [compost metagenome]
MFDAHEAVDLAGHADQLHQVALDVGDQPRDALDHLAGEVLEVLGEKDVVEVGRQRAVVLDAALEEALHARGQLAEVFRAQLAAAQALPFLVQRAGLVAQVGEQRGALLH